MTQINPYIVFNGTCIEAMNFYRECLGGELVLQTVGDSPMASQWPADAQKKILHASLTKDRLVLLGSDMTFAPLVQGNTVFLSLTCSSPEEIKTFFEKLSVGGEITHPLEEFFAGIIGNLTDKYGMKWMLYCPKN